MINPYRTRNYRQRLSITESILDEDGAWAIAYFYTREDSLYSVLDFLYEKKLKVDETPSIILSRFFLYNLSCERKTKRKG